MGWKTIRGTHVFVDNTGKITKGPAALKRESNKQPVRGGTNAALQKVQSLMKGSKNNKLGLSLAKRVGKQMGLTQMQQGLLRAKVTVLNLD